ncbi:MAG: pepsin/retropepsin-like aspartic protease family protein [Caulobacter sp.]
MPIAALFVAAALAAQAAPASTPQAAAASPAPMRLNTQIQFHTKDHASVPYELVNGYVVFKAKAAGQEVWALLDTGVTNSLIDTTLAKTAGLPIETLPGEIRTSTGVKVPKRIARNASFTVENQLSVQADAFGAMDLTAVSAMVGRKIGFVMGFDMIAISTLQLDPAAKTLDLRPGGSLRPQTGTVPVKVVDRQFWIEIQVGDKPVQVYLDTGSSVPLSLEPQAWARVAPAQAKLQPATTVGADGEMHVTDAGTAPAVQIGAVRYGDVRTQIMPAEGGESEGRVGMPLLRSFFLVLDARSGQLLLARRLPTAAPPAAN